MACVALESGRRVRFAIHGRSMHPLLREPMVLVVAPLNGRARIGDVLVFAWGDVQVAHRVVGYGAENYVTAGDAQPRATENVAPSAVVGRIDSVWADGSASARRVDGVLHRLGGFLYAYGYPIRRRAAAINARARAAVRRAPLLDEISGIPNRPHRTTMETLIMSDTFTPSAVDLEYRAAGNDVVVHDPVHERVHVLNRTAAFILQSCDGRHCAAGIAEELSSRTGAPRDRALADVERLLAELRVLELVS